MAWLKHPHTKQEMAAWFMAPEVKRRSKRSPRQLPTLWDDKARTDVNAKSWKKHRRTKWK
jgi:hypothetical protein